MSSKNLAQPTPEFVLREISPSLRRVYLLDGSPADMLTQVIFNMDKIGALVDKLRQETKK